MPSQIMSFLPKSHGKTEQMELQITSMADIFTIILVFLLKSYSASVINFSVSADVKLPVAFTGAPPVETLRVEVANNAILVEGNMVTPLANFELTAAEKNPSDGVIPTLSQALKRERDRQLEIAKQNPDVKPDARVLILSDRKAPFKVVRTVLRTATEHGYTDYKLVVAEEK